MRLLIELVWNRNVIYKELYAIIVKPFNRTSMESKLQNGAISVTLNPSAFNRTSMESKLTTISSQTDEKMLLLIEPVWNRNFSLGLLLRLRLRLLLIEPVWNRSNTPMFMVDSNNI